MNTTSDIRLNPRLQVGAGHEVALAVVVGLLGRLHEAELRYCHWKSNEHVDASVRGETDLDILVEPRRRDDLQRILADSGFRRFQASAITAYPAVEDYLGFDHATGRIVHLHLHHRLTLGQKYLKGYRLPWEEEILAARQFDTRHSIYVAAPEIELLLLLVRDALKRRLRSEVLGWVRGKPVTDDFSREFDWLVTRASPDAVVAASIRLIGPQTEKPLRRILKHSARPEDRRRFAAKARPLLASHRTYGFVSAAVLAAVREAGWILGGLSRRRFHWARALRRISPRGGVTVALLGSDGAGKSSLSADTVSWLGEKLDVVPIYFGSGDGPSSIVRMPLQLARGVVDKAVPSSSPSARRSGWRGRLRAAFLVPWALSLSLEKRTKIRRMVRARNRGLVVVCDRFAQDQIDGFNDGRLLAHLSSSSWRIARWIAAWEARPYHDAQFDPPDLVVKLIASPEVALSRRPEMRNDEIERRIAAVRSLRFVEPTVVVEIDADRPFAEVVREVRSLIWEIL